MTSLYVAGKFEERALVREAMDVLEMCGYEITHDWTCETTEGKVGNEVTDTLIGAAIDDLDGVMAADALVLFHNDACKGAFAEMGMALALDKPVIVIGGRQTLDAPVFYFLPGVIHVPHFDAALDALEMLFREAEQPEALNGNPEPDTCPPEECKCLLCNVDGLALIDLSKIGVA